MKVAPPEKPSDYYVPNSKEQELFRYLKELSQLPSQDLLKPF